ncbi:MAG: hypothetical protein ACPGTO_03265 [Polaribacter sp.]
MKLYFFTCCLLFSSFSLIAQQTTETNTIENQFNKIYKKSSTYKIYKVINKSLFIKLKTEVLDSLRFAKKNTIEKENLIKIKDDTIKNIQERINTIQLELGVLNKVKNTISFFGKRIKKTTYNVITFSVLIFLLLSLLYFLYKYIRSNALTKEAKSNLTDLDQEFEQHKKKSLVNEQKLRRQLQDEINKQKNL